MGLIDEKERAAAIQNLLSLTNGPGRRWYAYLMVVVGLVGPILVLVGAFFGTLWLMLVGVALCIPAAAWVGALHGQFQGASDVATVAVDQLIAHTAIAEDPASSALLTKLVQGR